MNSHTNRSAGWNIRTSWWLVLEVFGCGILNFLGFLYVGLISKKTKWVVIGVLSLIAEIFCFSTIISNIWYLSALLGLTNWLGSIIYAFVINKEFLQRMDAIRRHNQIEGHTELKIIPTEKTIATSNQSQTGLQFIADLQKWEMAVTPARLKNDIARLAQISRQIIDKDGVESNDFFIRYADPVNQLLAKYYKIETARINTTEAENTLRETEEFIEKVAVVFEKEFVNLYKTDLLDINTDIEAFTQTLKNRGLLDDDKL